MSQVAGRRSQIAHGSPPVKHLWRLTFAPFGSRTTHYVSRITFYVLLMLALLLPKVAVQAQGVTVTNASVEYSFAQRMAFRLTAKIDADIKFAKVYMRARNAPAIEAMGVLTTSVLPTGKTIEATSEQQLVGGVLPPFSTVTYWWELTDAAGRKLATPPQSLDYVDNRFTWQDVGEGTLGVRVHWYAGESDYAANALAVARAALPRLNQELQAPLPPRVDIYLYAATEELQSALELGGRDWQGGQARPDLGVVVVAIPPGQGALAQMKRDIPHELTHLLVYQATGAGYARVPRWLDEGLASANEELAQPAYQLALEAALNSNQLVPLETLCAPFSADAGVAQLSYAQSQSVIQYIRNSYPDGVRKLLGAYARGATCGGGVEQALGSTLGAFDRKWRATLGPRNVLQTVASSAGAWVLLALIVSLALLPFVLPKPSVGTRGQGDGATR